MSYRKHPDGEWPGYFNLKKEDIEQESWQYREYITKSLVDNRKGRVVVLFEYEEYMKFLAAVKKKFGNYHAENVDKAMHEAVKMWMESI